MANKKISLTYEGDSALIDGAIEALAIVSGWTESSKESKEVFAKMFITNYIRLVVQQHNVRQAEKVASEAAKEASLAVLDAITVVLEVE